MARGCLHLQAFGGRGNKKAAVRLTTELRHNRGKKLAVNGFLRRLGNRSKATQLQTLHTLLELQDLELALPVYKHLTEEDWFKWDPTLHARVVVLVASAKRAEASFNVVVEPPRTLTTREKEKLWVALVGLYAQFGFLDESLAASYTLQSLPLMSSRRRGYQALIRAYASSSLPFEGKRIMQSMQVQGFKPSLDDYKSLLHSFGREGHFLEMERILQEMTGKGAHLDTSGFNMMISAYGVAKRHDKVRELLERMHRINVPCSLPTWNAVSKSCPNLTEFFAALKEFPGGLSAILGSLEAQGFDSGELSTVQVMLSLGLPQASVKWSGCIWELDLHGMFLVTAYVSLFLWLQELRARYMMKSLAFPKEVRLIIGQGIHSNVEGDSSVRKNIVQLLERTGSPFRVDSDNRGVLVARGLNLKAWLILS